MKSRIVFEDSNASAYQWGKYELGLGRHYTWQKSEIASRNKYKWGKYNAVVVERPTYIWKKYALNQENQYYSWDKSPYSGKASYSWDKYDIIPAGNITYIWSKNYPTYTWEKFNAVSVPQYKYTYSINNSYTTYPVVCRETASSSQSRPIMAAASLSSFVRVGSATISQATSSRPWGSDMPSDLKLAIGSQSTINTSTGIQSVTGTKTDYAPLIPFNNITSLDDVRNAAVGTRLFYIAKEWGSLTNRTGTTPDFGNYTFAVPSYFKPFSTYHDGTPMRDQPFTALNMDPGYFKMFPYLSTIEYTTSTAYYWTFYFNLLFVKESNTKVGIYMAGIDNYGVSYSRVPTGETVIEKGSYVGSATSTSRNAYPDDNYEGNYWYVYDGYQVGTYIEDVKANTRDAYPDNGIVDPYYYIYKGDDVAYIDQRGDKVGSQTASTRDAYPDNGVQNGYWYVYTGTNYVTQYYTTAKYLSSYSSSYRVYYSDVKPTLNRSTGRYTMSYIGSYTYSQMTAAVINSLLSAGRKYLMFNGYSGIQYYYELLPTTTRSGTTYSNLLRYDGGNQANGAITEYGNYLGLLLYNSAYWQELDQVNKMPVRGNFIEEIEDEQRNTYPDDGAAANYYWVYDRTVGQETIGQGTYIEDVYDYSLDAYPADGVYSGYWYLYEDYEVEYYRGDTIGEVNSIQADAYPNNGIQSGYWYLFTDTSEEQYAGQFIDFVSNPSRSYYPDNGAKNGFWYVYISPIGSDLYTLTTSEMTKQPTYKQTVNTQDDYCIGDAVAASCEFEFLDPDNFSPQYKKLKFRYYTMQGDETEWKLIGRFLTKEVTRVDDYSCKIIGYDEVSLFDIYVDDWIENATWPMTLGQMFQSLCAYCGAAFVAGEFTNSTFDVRDNFTGINTTGRQILAYIAQAAGGFIYANASGAITIKQYIDTGVTLDKTKYNKATVEEYTTPKINKLTVQMTEDDYGVSSGDGDVVYKITNNPLFYAENEDEIKAAVDRIFAVIKQVSYTPCSIDLSQDYNINCGDIITINGKKSYIMGKTITSSGVKLESFGTETREATGEETNSEIIALRGKTNELTRTLEQTQSTITDTAAELRSEITQTANEINSTVSSQGEVITQIRQGLDGISLVYNSSNGTASITIGDVTVSQLTDAGYVNRTIAGINLNGYVQFNDLSQAGRTTINGANITTGTISADRLALTGSIAWGDLSSSCKNTIIEYAEDAASQASGVPSYIHSTYIDQTNIYSPNIYGAKITAGSSSDGYIQMSSNGMSFKSNVGGSLIGMGYYPGNYNYPYIIFGAGVDSYGSDRGMIKKYSNGIWIGDSDGISSSTVGSGDGIFIRFTDHTIWAYKNGSAKQLA